MGNIILEWKKPCETPIVKRGSEECFWLAVEIKRANKEPSIVTFLGQYQNRPYQNGDEEIYGDEYLVNTDGEYVDSVGWVTCQSHYEFDNYYELIQFSDTYRLLGWAYYKPPKFN